MRPTENSHDGQSRALSSSPAIIVLFDLLPLITSLSDFIYFDVPSLMPRDSPSGSVSCVSICLENAANDDKRLKFKFLSQFAR